MNEYSSDTKPNADISEVKEFEVPSQVQPSPEPLDWDGWGGEEDKARFDRAKAASDAASRIIQAEVSLELGNDGWGPEIPKTTK